MSGHSKFANIKHKKEKNDAAKGKISHHLDAHDRTAQADQFAHLRIDGRYLAIVGSDLYPVSYTHLASLVARRRFWWPLP